MPGRFLHFWSAALAHDPDSGFSIEARHRIRSPESAVGQPSIEQRPEVLEKTYRQTRSGHLVLTQCALVGIGFHSAPSCSGMPKSITGAALDNPKR